MHLYIEIFSQSLKHQNKKRVNINIMNIINTKYNSIKTEEARIILGVKLMHLRPAKLQVFQARCNYLVNFTTQRKLLTRGELLRCQSRLQQKSRPSSLLSELQHHQAAELL